METVVIAGGGNEGKFEDIGSERSPSLTSLCKQIDDPVVYKLVRVSYSFQCMILWLVFLSSSWTELSSSYFYFISMTIILFSYFWFFLSGADFLEGLVVSYHGQLLS